MIVPQIVHFKKFPYDIYIGRPSIWGNCFSSKVDTIAKFRTATKAESLTKHREWVFSQPDFILKIKKELRGKVLG